MTDKAKKEVRNGMMEMQSGIVSMTNLSVEHDRTSAQIAAQLLISPNVICGNIPSKGIVLLRNLAQIINRERDTL